MNKLLQDFAGQANFGTVDKAGNVVFDQRLDKFAQLIINRCATLVENAGLAQYNKPLSAQMLIKVVSDIRDEFEA